MAATIADEGLRAAFRERALRFLPARSQPGPGAYPLTARELDVLRLLVEGKADREIAAALSISPRTVMRHVAAILGKLNVSSRTAAATLALREEIV